MHSLKPYLTVLALLAISPLAHGTPKSLRVQTTIDGHLRKFMLDTGANMTTLSQDDQSESLPTVGTRQPIAAGGESITCDLVTINQLAFDQITDDDLTAQRCPANSNLLGIDSLNEKVFTLTFPDRQLTFLNAAPDEARTAPLNRSKEGHIEVPFEAAGEQGLALFDTGWSVTAVSSKIIAAHPESFTYLKKTQDSDAAGNLEETKVYRVSYFKVGNVELKDEVVEAYDFPADAAARLGGELQGIVGLSTIQKANWLFDLKNNRWATAEATSQPETN